MSASGSLPRMGVQTGTAPSGRSLAASQSPTPVSTQSNSPRQAGLQGPRVCAHSSVHGGTAHKQEGPREPVDGRVSEPGSPLPQATVHGRLCAWGGAKEARPRRKHFQQFQAQAGRVIAPGYRGWLPPRLAGLWPKWRVQGGPSGDQKHLSLHPVIQEQ